jgi:nucleoside-diphosphate-sugar epimerase
MRAFIVGCGRVGAGIAERLARAGHDVTVIDISTEAFARLEPGFSIVTIYYGEDATLDISMAKVFCPPVPQRPANHSRTCLSFGRRCK